MYPNGTVVTLIDTKTHGEGEDAMSLSANTCGMIVQRHRKAVDNNHEYVVDFGPYGQWYCYHNELTGQAAAREDGWERDDEPTSMVARLLESVRDDVVIDHNSEKLPPAIDFEADLKRRMKEIESGDAY